METLSSDAIKKHTNMKLQWSATDFEWNNRILQIIALIEWEYSQIKVLQGTTHAIKSDEIEKDIYIRKIKIIKLLQARTQADIDRIADKNIPML